MQEGGSCRNRMQILQAFSGALRKKLLLTKRKSRKMHEQGDKKRTKQKKKQENEKKKVEFGKTAEHFVKKDASYRCQTVCLREGGSHLFLIL